MPSKNSIKIHAAEQYYHVYNRGANKQNIFLEDSDYVYFLYLIKRHLGKEPVLDKYERAYRHLYSDVSLLAYCLMPNHFHLLILNKEPQGMEQLLRSVSTGYSMYFNKKYKRSGHVFQGVYKASMIESDKYLQHISRYIHLNPKDYKNYEYSSYRAMVQNWSVEWLDIKELMETFEGDMEDYKKFVADYEDYKEMLDEIKHDLADQ